jgi:hypothetical protein
MNKKRRPFAVKRIGSNREGEVSDLKTTISTNIHTEVYTCTVEGQAFLRSHDSEKLRFWIQTLFSTVYRQIFFLLNFAFLMSEAALFTRRLTFPFFNF